MIPVARNGGPQAGLTALEAVISVAAFAVIGYGLAAVMDFGRRSQETVGAIAVNNERRQESTAQLARELGATSDARIQVQALPDGNSQLTFQMPIEIGGVLGWGVEDRRLGLDAADQVREDWSIRYTVESEAGLDVAGLDLTSRRLVRQVLNEQGEVVRSDTVGDQLRSGAEKPGFHVERVGDVWELRIATQSVDHDTPSLDTVIHVVTRN
jgi:hypothetical protein